MKVLLAVDGSAFGEEAAREVARRPWPDGSEVRVISVVEPVYMPAAEPWALQQNYLDELERLAAEKARAAVEGALKILRERDDTSMKFTSDTPRGPAKQTIIEEAERWGADLLVLGSHGYGFWSRLVLGSVSQAVAAHSPCSVEIIKRRESKEGGKN